eukprot:gene4504-7884_t
MSSEEYKFEDFENQFNEIENERNQRPYISKVLDIEDLLNEYKNGSKEIYKQIQVSNANFELNMKKNLSKTYPRFRRIRGDGNCFYRATIFGFLEFLIKSKETKLLEQLETVLKEKDEFKKLGFDEFIFEEFQSVLLDVLQEIKTGKVDLEKVFLDPTKSEYIVCFLRLVVSAYIQLHKDDYLPFLFEFNTIEEFCRKEVEPMGKEADNIHISAMTSKLPICVQIEYLDSQNQNSLKFPENQEPKVFLLFRPGHYDILYKKN